MSYKMYLFLIISIVISPYTSYSQDQLHDPMPALMANCFAQVLIHGLAAAHAGENKQARQQELSIAIQCAAQFMVQFFGNTKRSLINFQELHELITKCLQNQDFLEELAAEFERYAIMLSPTSCSHEHEPALAVV